MYQPINGWTKQSILDHIRITFKGRSVGGPNGKYVDCLYRGPNGKKCAVGMFIPDELYSPVMEGRGVADVLTPRLAAVMPLPPKAMSLLQAVHDENLGDQKILCDMLEWVENYVQETVR